MQLLALCLFICSQMTNVVEADGKDFVVKSQSLWRLCEELDDNLHLQQKLQLTDVQVKKVDELFCGKKFQDLLVEKERLAKLKSEGGRSDGNHEIYWAIESEVTREVESFLSEKQIFDLKRFSLAMRCPSGLSPFYDREILASAGIVIDDQLQKYLDQKQEQYWKQRRQLTTQAITSFLGEFPVNDRVLLAQFLGDKYIPGIMVSPIPTAEIGEVPFLDPSWALQSNTLRELLDPKSNLASRIGISRTQQLQLAELKQSITHRMGRVSPLKTYFDRLRDIFTDQQIVSLARIRNEELIPHNFSWPFRSSQIKDYLGLDEQAAKELLTFSESEDKKLRDKIATLDRQTFQEICEKIPALERQKIQRLFAEVW